MQKEVGFRGFFRTGVVFRAGRLGRCWKARPFDLLGAFHDENAECPQWKEIISVFVAHRKHDLHHGFRTELEKPSEIQLGLRKNRRIEEWSLAERMKNKAIFESRV